MRTLLFSTLALAVIAFAPLRLNAQVGFGLAGGPSYPTGALGNVVHAGFHAGAVAELGIPLFPLGLRADLLFQNLPGREGRRGFRQLSGTLNARFGLVPIPIVSPYFIAGLGLYGSSFHPQPDSDGWGTDTGVNAGVGARINLLVIRPFVEARYHRVFSDPGRGFIPVAFGLTF